MKKTTLSLLFVLFIGISSANAQTTMSATERKLADSVCNCIAQSDLSKITNKPEAVSLFTTCITKHADLLMTLAEEHHVEVSNDEEMRKLGLQLGMNMMKMQCTGFVKLSTFLAVKELDDKGSSNNNLSSATTGNLKRIDNKGFNYLVINDGGAEKSFLWLRQFPGSEKFNNGIATMIGKKVTVNWQEIEVFLPVAKGYYKVKEITGISFL